MCGLRSVIFVVLIMLIEIPGESLLAQTSAGRIIGTITDQGGAPLPGATVTLANRDTAIETKETTQANGYFTFLNVRPGAYTMNVAASGFASVAIAQFLVEVNQTVTRDATLAVGALQQVVEVRAEAEMVQAGSSEVGNVIRKAAVANLPLNGRNFTQMLILSPGATPVSTATSGQPSAEGNGTTTLPGSGFAQPAIQGQINRSAVYYMDGINNTDYTGNTYAILPNVDLIQEFKVQSHNDKAEFGGVAGGVINVVSVSGTNQLHGTAFWFLRNNEFDARDTFIDARRKGPIPFHQNQFGATIGGPIIKNKMFYSGGFEGWRYKKPTGDLYLSPSAAELGGDFSQSVLRNAIYDPTTTRADPNTPGGYLRSPFPGNIIPKTQLNPMAVGFFEAYYDQPNYVGIVAGLNNQIVVPRVSENNSYQGKVDYQINDKDNAWFRVNLMRVNSAFPWTNKQNRLSNIRAKNIGGAYLHVFSPTFLVELRGGFSNRPFALGWRQVDYDSWNCPPCDGTQLEKLGFAGIKEYGPIKFDIPGAVGNPYQSNIGAAAPNPRDQPIWTFSPSVTKIAGSHTIQFGLQFLRQARTSNAPGHEYWFARDTTADPTRVGSTGNELATAVLGYPFRRFAYSIPLSPFKYHMEFYSPYVQDVWRVSRNVTVTVGLRWDYQSQPTVTKGLLSRARTLDGTWVVGGDKLPPSCNSVYGTDGWKNGTILSCIPGNGLQDVPFGNKIVLAEHPGNGRNSRYSEFGPRASVAWRPLKDTVLRAGYGLVYDWTAGWITTYSSGNQQWPFSGGFDLTQNLLGQPLQSLQQLMANFPSRVVADSPWGAGGFGNSSYDPTIRDPRSHQWNVEIQHQLARDVLMSVAYVGSVNQNTLVFGQDNVAKPGPGSPAVVNARRPYPWMTSYQYIYSNGSANYNSLQMKLDRRFAKGFNALVSYTWSKSIDTGSSGYGNENGPGGSSAVQDLQHPENDRSVSSYDIPHFFTASVNWEPPVGKGKAFLSHGPVSYILGNWQTNLLATFRSGQPYNLQVSGDVGNIGQFNSGYNYARPNLVGDPHVDNPTADRWFNPAAFSVPQFSFGNFGRNVLRSSHVSNVDFSVFKIFPVRELGAVELRVETFNIFNIQNYAPPSGLVIGQSSAGRVTATATTPRSIQLGLRIRF